MYSSKSRYSYLHLTHQTHIRGESSIVAMSSIPRGRNVTEWNSNRMMWLWSLRITVEPPNKRHQSSFRIMILHKRSYMHLLSFALFQHLPHCTFWLSPIWLSPYMHQYYHLKNCNINFTALCLTEWVLGKHFLQVQPHSAQGFQTTTNNYNLDASSDFLQIFDSFHDT